jgi:hypothetical protein
VAARNQAEESLAEIRITKDDFTDLLWPEFPQSRPYVHIPVDEAWFFEAAKLHEGEVSAQSMAKDRALVLEGVQTIRVLEFTNFRMLEVRVFARDEKGGQSLELTGKRGRGGVGSVQVLPFPERPRSSQVPGTRRICTQAGRR